MAGGIEIMAAVQDPKLIANNKGEESQGVSKVGGTLIAGLLRHALLSRAATHERCLAPEPFIINHRKKKTAPVREKFATVPRA
jgi:hypothetical protein